MLRAAARFVRARRAGLARGAGAGCRSERECDPRVGAGVSALWMQGGGPCSRADIEASFFTLMKTLRRLVQSDANATVTIDVPVSGSLRQFEVLVVWQEVGPDDAKVAQWPQGWFEATAGSIDDPSFIRHPQGVNEDRETL